ncbi:hypothetical protein AGLY_008410 [Aphis glycines]|uniref:Uncharacterized protein n=1 Tax=Aphis glycines TaxID=307491 RepID=A0A6G0TKI6_APHGL|nr:hypothetical protein AGLY_008410 [Aphis glycines]
MYITTREEIRIYVVVANNKRRQTKDKFQKVVLLHVGLPLITLTQTNHFEWSEECIDSIMIYIFFVSMYTLEHYRGQNISHRYLKSSPVTKVDTNKFILSIDNSAYWIHYTQQKDNPLQSPSIFLKYYYEINQNYGKYSMKRRILKESHFTHLIIKPIHSSFHSEFINGFKVIMNITSASGINLILYKITKEDEQKLNQPTIILVGRILSTFNYFFQLLNTQSIQLNRYALKINSQKYSAYQRTFSIYQGIVFDAKNMKSLAVTKYCLLLSLINPKVQLITFDCSYTLLRFYNKLNIYNKVDKSALHRPETQYEN